MIDRRLTISLIVIEVALIVLYGVFVDYYPADDKEHAHVNNYAYFQDVHIMIFVGFGFLMTFLKRYGYGAVSFNLLLAAVAVQWSILLERYYHYSYTGVLEKRGPFKIYFLHIIEGDIAAAAVLISFGAVLGRLHPLQLLVMTLLEVVFYAVNFRLGVEVWGVLDPGGSILVHTFGAFFGLAVSVFHYKKYLVEHKWVAPTYHSNLFSMIGTIFLWICWPSFNACLLADPANQYRAVVNTFFSMCSSTLMVFSISSLLHKEALLGMDYIQNATLAGGVAIGALADQAIGVFGAMIVGAVAGTVSTVGFHYLTPFLNAHRIFDTCGVHNLHGMPGLISGVASAVATWASTQSQYDGDLVDDPAKSNYLTTFPDSSLTYLNATTGEQIIIEGRSSGMQGVYQLLCIACTLAMAIGGGLITGLLLRLPFWGHLDEHSVFDDEAFWEMPVKNQLTARKPSAPAYVHPDSQVFPSSQLRNNAAVEMTTTSSGNNENSGGVQVKFE